MSFFKVTSAKISTTVKDPKTRKQLLWFILISLPIVAYCWSFLVTGNLVAPGDADYLMQTQEAMRRSVLEYHQFPWWNPWVSGGVPLFANAQFGLVSITTPLTLLFGAIIGFKISLFLYLVIGFWGFYRLFTKVLRTPTLTAILLSYIWTFSSFWAQRISGHYTFFVMEYFPWLLYFYLRRRKDKHAWIKFGLIASIMTWSASHDMTVLSYLVIAFIFVGESIRLRWHKEIKAVSVAYQGTPEDWKFVAKTSVLFVVLTAYRLLFAIQYLHEFPKSRLGDPEPTIGIAKALFGMFGPIRQFINSPSTPQWSWLEVSYYIGISTGICALVIMLLLIRKHRQSKTLFSYSPHLLLVLIAWFFVLSLGSYVGKYSPYMIMRHLPVLSDMRVATRWLAWCSMFILIFIATYRGKSLRMVINILLLISCVELFFYCRPYLARPYFATDNQVRPASAQFEQKRLWGVLRGGVSYDENLTGATDNNYGQVVAGDSLVDTRWGPPAGTGTVRCGVDQGCDFVMSHNAVVTYWSPDKIILKRTAPGPIYLDANPSKYWEINGVYAFLNLKVANPTTNFVITNPTKTITLQCTPRFSIEWVLHKL